MGQIGRTALKAYFETGDIPTEAQFIDLIDSVLNISEDTSDTLTEGSTKLLLTTTERSAISTNSSKISFPEAPIDGSQYARKNGGWEVAAGGNTFDAGLTVDTTLTYLPANGVKFGDGDTAIYEDFDDQLRVRMAGINQWTFYSFAFRGVNSAGPAMVNETVSGTNPTLLPHNGDLDTGLGRAGADQLSNIAGGVEVIRCTTTGAYLQVIKSGATQAAAGANAGEMWKTSGHATLPDNVIMHGV